MPQKKTQVISDTEITAIAEEYGFAIDPDNATQYKLCQIIINLEQALKDLENLRNAAEAGESPL